MKFLCWNVRGLVKPSTQYEVLNLIKKHDISIFGVLETKLKESNLGDMMKNKFGGWSYAHNFTHHPRGRIVVSWDPSRVVFNPMTITHQLLHGKLICLVNKIEIHVSFVYALNKVILRRDLWHSLSSFGHDIEGPWTLLGDFNNVLHPQERVNGSCVTMYETRDFMEVCSHIAILGTSPHVDK